MSIIAQALRFAPLNRRVQILHAATEYLPEAAYGRLAAFGFSPSAIIDIGAARGEWAKLIRPFFPGIPILMVEGREKEERWLKQTAEFLRPADYRVALLASEERSANFNMMETGSSLFAELSDEPRSLRLMRTTTLDSLLCDLARFQRGPLLMKLDVQGAELEILRGAKSALEQTEVAQLETALTEYNEGAPLAAEVFAFMADHGFALWDIAGFGRPMPSYLAQIDFIFLRGSSQMRRRFFKFKQPG